MREHSLPNKRSNPLLSFPTSPCLPASTSISNVSCHPQCRLSPLRGGSEGGIGDPGFIGHRMHKTHKETWIVTAIARTLPAFQRKQSPIVIPVLSLPAGFPLRCGEGVRVGLGIQGLLATERTKLTKGLLYSAHRVIPAQAGIQASFLSPRHRDTKSLLLLNFAL